MIPVELEEGSPEDWDGIIESCIFCDNKTRYRHKITNKPICPTCAEVRKVDEIKKQQKRALQGIKLLTLILSGDDKERCCRTKFLLV